MFWTWQARPRQKRRRFYTKKRKNIMLIKLLTDIENYGHAREVSLLTTGKIVAVDSKLGPVWVAKGWAEPVYAEGGDRLVRISPSAASRLAEHGITVAPAE